MCLDLLDPQNAEKSKTHFENFEFSASFTPYHIHELQLTKVHFHESVD